MLANLFRDRFEICPVIREQARSYRGTSGAIDRSLNPVKSMDFQLKMSYIMSKRLLFAHYIGQIDEIERHGYAPQGGP